MQIGEPHSSSTQQLNQRPGGQWAEMGKNNQQAEQDQAKCEDAQPATPPEVSIGPESKVKGESGVKGGVDLRLCHRGICKASSMLHERRKPVGRGRFPFHVDVA